MCTAQRPGQGGHLLIAAGIIKKSNRLWLGLRGQGGMDHPVISLQTRSSSIAKSVGERDCLWAEKKLQSVGKGGGQKTPSRYGPLSNFRLSSGSIKAGDPGF